MKLTVKKNDATYLEWICENRAEIQAHLESNSQAKTAARLGVSFSYLNMIVMAWNGVPGLFPTYPGGQPVAEWLTETAQAVQILCKIFNDNYKMTAAYLMIPYPTLRQAVTKWRQPSTEVDMLLKDRASTEKDLIAQGVKVLPRIKFEEYLEHNTTRKAAALKPLELKVRNCLKCGNKFESTGDRLCGCNAGEMPDYWEAWK